MKTKLLIAILTCCAATVFSMNSRLYGSGDLTCNLVETLCQDSHGFVWIGTAYGLNKFDGMRFKSYLHNEKDPKSLLGNFVHVLKTDRNKTLWVGCSNGLQYYLPEEDAFQTIKFENNCKPYITGILELHTGEIWVITSGRGVFLINKKEAKATFLPEVTRACGSQFATCIYEDRKKNVWIGTDHSGFVRIDTRNMRSEKYCISGHPNAFISDFAEDTYGNFYVSSNSVIEMLDKRTKQFTSIPYTGTDPLWIYQMTAGRKGGIYVATDGQGLKYIDTATRTLRNVDNISSSFNFSNAKIRKVFEDKDQNLWLGCYYAGALVLPNEPKQFNLWIYSENPNIISGTVTAICKDYQGFVWCSINNEGIFKYNSQGKTVARFPALKSAITIFQDSKKTHWIGTANEGLGILNPTSGAVKYLPAFGGKKIKCIAEDKYGYLYISTFGKGMDQLNLSTGSIRHFDMTLFAEPASKLTNNWVNIMLPDKDGLLWIGHYKGVDCYDTRNNCFIKLKESETLSKNVCFSLLEDKKGNIWFGTNNGLFCHNKMTQQLKCYTTDQGLSNNVISGLAEDQKGDIWCSTYNGINQLKIRNGQIVNYYSGNGLSGKGYTVGAYYNDLNGLVYFGGNFGITVFNPLNITQRGYHRKVCITNLYLQGKTVNTSTLSNGNKVVSTPISIATEFHLSHIDNTFTIELSTMDFIDQEDISYEYRLNKLSDVWHSSLPGDNRITYNNLPPGNYKLEVRASKNGSYSPVSVYKIYISAPWYRTVPAYIVYLLVIIALVRMGVNTLRHKREKRINEAKFQLFINISHEIRSPMTLIISPLEKLMKETYDENTQRALQTIQRNANRVLGLINQLLDVRKFDKGQMQIKCSETDMVKFINEALSVFEYQARDRNIRMSFEHNMDRLPVWIDRNNFDKILINLLSNSFKYTPDFGEITVILTSGIDERKSVAMHRYFEIRVLDSGIGLDKDKLNKIFERFYQIENELTFASMGTGIGLNLCRILVELHHGTIVATNRQESAGSCFTIRIPLGNDHLRHDEIVSHTTDMRPVLQNYTNTQIPLDKANVNRPKTNYKVLIVDDEAEIREFLRQELEESYKIITCNDGIEALREIHANMPDLVISDVMMPEMNGFTLLRKIKTNSNLSHIPVILLTSRIEHEDRMEGLDKGADAYLCKPFNTDELAILTKKLIANRILLKGKYSGAQDQKEKIKAVEFKSSDELLMERIMLFVNNNIDNSDLNVELLAQFVGLGRVQLHRKLKEMTGLPTAEFIRNLRLKQAAILLKDKKINITQIAYAVGFTSQAHFSTAFRKFYGVSPREYIQQLDS